MKLGYTEPLYFLPFDHRGSLESALFQWTEPLNQEQVNEISLVKRIIYDGFVLAIKNGVSKSSGAILVDEQFGRDILLDATKAGYLTACPVEKSGTQELTLEYGEDFQEHVETVNTTFCKVLLHYNPGGDREMNQRQASLLERVSSYCHASERLLLVELLVKPEAHQLENFHGRTLAFELELRPRLMVQAICELQDAGVQPDVWKVEGLDRREDAMRVVEVAKRSGRDGVGCVVLGGGADIERVTHWLSTAASVPGFTGFAIGRTTFWDSILDWRTHAISRETAVMTIAKRYQQWVEIFEQNLTLESAKAS